MHGDGRPAVCDQILGMVYPLMLSFEATEVVREDLETGYSCSMEAHDVYNSCIIQSSLVAQRRCPPHRRPRNETADQLLDVRLNLLQIPC